MHPAPARIGRVEAQLWACLEDGAAAGPSPFSLMQLATIGTDGTPKLRTVVLRGVSRPDGQATFHTDRRSAKVAELRQHPAVALLGLDAGRGWQIRLEGQAAIVTDEALRLAAWQASRAHSRRLYQGPLAPGTKLAAGQDGPVLPPASAGDDGFGQFCVVTVALQRLEWLDLSLPGHRRAEFRRTPSGWTGDWLAP